MDLNINPPSPPNALWKDSRQMAQNMLIGPSPQGQDIFWYLLIGFKL